MWAVEKCSEPLLRHVASIAAEYLDNNEDGVVDDPAVNTALVDNYAAMYLVDAFDKFSKFDYSDQSPMHRFKTTVAQHSGETNPQGSECGSHCGQPNDSTREEVLHLIQQAGYGFAYPALRPQTADGPLPENLLTDAMRIAQQNGDYTRFDSAAGQEYFYWGLTSLLGAQGNPGRCAAISDEWKLCTAEKLKASNPTFYALLTNPSYKLPTRLPDGGY